MAINMINSSVVSPDTPEAPRAAPSVMQWNINPIKTTSVLPLNVFEMEYLTLCCTDSHASSSNNCSSTSSFFILFNLLLLYFFSKMSDNFFKYKH